MSTALRVPHRLTVAEFQDWRPPADLEGRRWELVDGEPVCMLPPSLDHGLIQAELAYLLRSWLVANRPDCNVAVTPGVIPKVRSGYNERIPDLAVFCGPVRPAKVMDAPRLLIEILSPSNDAKTRANVWAYTSIPSVQEILLISSTSISAELLRRDADRGWPSDPALLGQDAELTLDSIGLSLPLRAAYATSSLV